MYKLMKMIVLAAVSCAFADIAPETDGMEADTRGDGTFLMAGPTYSYDRSSMQGGIHSGSEEWSPEKLRMHLLMNRYSLTPSWDIAAPAVWASTGNEIGDLLLYDLSSDGSDKWGGNRTPMMEGGFRSKSYKGFWVTARGIQVDHYSSATMGTRMAWVGRTDYSLFGENLPFESSVYAGLGYSGHGLETSVLAGHEYLWVMGESGRWIPYHTNPRVEGRIDYKNVQATFTYQNMDFENDAVGESGTRDEISGTVRAAPVGPDSADPLKIGGGVAFRSAQSHGTVYFGLEDDYVVWPFAEFELKPTDRLEISGFGGVNNRDWLVKDSVRLSFNAPYGVKPLVGFKNHLGTTLNPLGDTYEYFDGDTLDLRADGYMQLHRLFFDLRRNADWFSMGFNVAGWFEKGAETFDTTGFVTDGPLTYRTGNMGRIDSWIRGLTGEANVEIRYSDEFSLGARAGVERIRGDEKRFEVNPSEEWVEFKAHWFLLRHFTVDQSLAYRSDAKWNLRTEDPMVIKGDWYWNASFSQLFPEYGLSLTGTVLHTLSRDAVLVPNGGYDRTRFYCNIRKTF